MATSGRTTLQFANVVAFVLTIIVNSLANILPLNGKNTGELSDAYPNLFVPAGYVFAIWGVIYVLLGVYCVYQFSSTRKDSAFQEKISWLFVLSSAANIGWIFFWHYEILPLSVVAMAVILVSLLMIYVRLDIGKIQAERNEKLAVQLPFSVYLGWITLATVANITALLVGIGWDRFGIPEILWTQLILGVVLLLTTLMLILRKDIAYALVVTWAGIGIYMKQMVLTPEIALTALIVTGAVVILTVATALYPYLSKSQL
jgi:hypothetical protein